MDTGVLKIVGEFGGIGGLVLGVLLLLFQEIIRKNIFPKLPPAKAYRLLRLITVAVWSVAFLGVAVWAYTRQSQPSVSASNCSVASGGASSGNTINCSTPPTMPGTTR